MLWEMENSEGLQFIPYVVASWISIFLQLTCHYYQKGKKIWGRAILSITLVALMTMMNIWWILRPGNGLVNTCTWLWIYNNCMHLDKAYSDQVENWLDCLVASRNLKAVTIDIGVFILNLAFYYTGLPWNKTLIKKMDRAVTLYMPCVICLSGSIGPKVHTVAQTLQKLLGLYRTEDRFWHDFADIKHGYTQ